MVQTSLLQRTIENIMVLKELIIITLILTGIMFLLFEFYTRSFGWTRRNRRLMGLFYHIRLRESILMAICLMKFDLIISIIIGGGRIYNVQFILYGALELGYLVILRRIKKGFLSLFNSGVMLAVLYASNFLTSYMQEIQFILNLAIVNVMMIVFILVYAAYDLAWTVLSVVEEGETRLVRMRHEEERKEQSEQQTEEH